MMRDWQQAAMVWRLLRLVVDVLRRLVLAGVGEDLLRPQYPWLCVLLAPGKPLLRVAMWPVRCQGGPQ